MALFPPRMTRCGHGCGRKAEGVLRRGGEEVPVCKRCGKLVEGGVVEMRGGCGRRVLVSPASPLAGVRWALPRHNEREGLVSILRPVAEGIGLQLIAGTREREGGEEGRGKGERAPRDLDVQFDDLPPEILVPIVMGVHNGYDLEAMSRASVALRQLLRDPKNAARKIGIEYTNYMQRLQVMKDAAGPSEYDPSDPTDLPNVLDSMYFDQGITAGDYDDQEDEYGLERRRMFSTLLAVASKGDTYDVQVGGVVSVTALVFVDRLPRQVQQFIADYLLGLTDASVMILRSIYAQPWVNLDMRQARVMFRSMFHAHTDRLAEVYFAGNRQDMTEAGTAMWVMKDPRSGVSEDTNSELPMPHQEILEQMLMKMPVVTARDLFNLWYFQEAQKFDDGWSILYFPNTEDPFRGGRVQQPVWRYPTRKPLQLVAELMRAGRLTLEDGWRARMASFLDREAYVRDPNAIVGYGALGGYTVYPMLSFIDLGNAYVDDDDDDDDEDADITTSKAKAEESLREVAMNLPDV